MTNSLAVMQPYFIPYLGYFQMINAVDIFVLYDDVNFIKSSYINRNKIINNTSNLYLTLPVKNISSFKKINEHELALNDKIKNKMLKQVKQNYAKAPYFDAIYNLFEKIMNYENSNLSEFLHNSLSEITSYLEIPTKLVSSTIYNNQDFSRQERLIDICRKEDSKNYINSIGGQELYNKEDFAKEGIELHFHQMKPIQYNQFSEEFVPNLSIIDVMMFNDKDKIKELLESYTLT